MQAAHVVVALGLLALGTAVGWTAWGLSAVLRYRRAPRPLAALSPGPAVSTREPSPAAGAPDALTVELAGVGPLPVEPGVLLNTLWEHLPDADCQNGECGGCRVRLLAGEVTWIREPVAPIDRRVDILPCSCEAVTSLRCALPNRAANG